MTVPSLRSGSPTPWGPAQHVEDVRPGIWRVETASHGGYYVAPSLRGAIRPEWRTRDGWYEEDVEWVAVALAYPCAFPRAHAVLGEAGLQKLAAEWLPPARPLIRGGASR